MAEGISEYNSRSALTLAAVDRFRRSLEAGGRVREVATGELLRVTGPDATANAVLGYAGQPGVRPTIDPQYGFSSVLLDLQSANLLMAAGISMKESGTSGDTGLLNQARQQVSATRDELAAGPQTMGFAAQLGIESATSSSAKQAFESYSGQLLAEIVDKSAETIALAWAELQHLPSNQILEALGKIGTALPGVAEAGRLIRAGIEKLKRAIEAIAALFGAETIDGVKDQVRGVWEKLVSGEYTRELLERFLGVPSVSKSIQESLAGSNLTPGVIDRATNALPTVATDFDGMNKLLRGLVAAIKFAAGVLAFLHFAGPWPMLALAVASVSVIGAVLLIGGEYTGGRAALHWTDSVRHVAEAIPASV